MNEKIEYLDSTIQKDLIVEKWYSNRSYSENITNIDPGFYDTKEIVRSYIKHINGEYSKTGDAWKKLFSNIIQAFQKGFKEFEPDFENQDWRNQRLHILSHFAFFNYFQRPELKAGKQFNGCHLDEVNSYNLVSKMIEILKPNEVFILSDLAGRSYVNQSLKSVPYYSHKITFLYHPADNRTWFKKISQRDDAKFSEIMSNEIFNLLSSILMR